MPDTKYDIQKARLVLEESRAASFQSSDPNLRKDGELVRVFKNMDRKYVDHCVRFLEDYTSAKNPNPVHSVVDPMVDGVPRTGTWRGAEVITREEWNDTDREMQINLYQTLREGWSTAIDYATGILIEENNMPSNTEGTGAWASDTPATRFARIMLPAIDPSIVETLAATLGQTTTLTNQKIGNRTYSGAWHIVYAKPRRDEQDHSGWIELFIAQPQLTLEGFEDAGTPDERANLYALRVPEAVAQTVLDGWKTANPIGSSARFMGTAEEGLVNLVLSKSAATAETVTFGGLYAACDTIIDIYFAWGYTSAELQVFYDAFQSAPGSGVSVEFPRPLRRSDGFFDAMVIKTTRTASTVTVTLTIGKDITRTVTAAWNIGKDGLSAAAAIYGQAERGRIGEFTVTRNNENCTYDYVGVLTVRTDDSNVTTFGGVGIEEETTRNTGLNPAGTYSNVSTTDGEIYEDRFEPNEDGLWARFLRKITRKNMASVAAAGGDFKATTAITVGQIKKSDAATIGAAATEGVSIELAGLQLGDDGILQYIKVVTTETAHNGSIACGEYHSAETETVGVIGESEASSLNETPAVGKSTKMSFLQSKQNGMLIYRKNVVTKTFLRKDDLVAGAYLFPETHKQGINTAPGDIPASAALTQGQRRELRIGLNDLGQAEYKVVDTAPVAATTTVEGNKLYDGDEIGTTIKRYLTVARNQTALPSLSANEKIESFRITDEGLYDYIIRSLAETGSVSFVAQRQVAYENDMHSMRHDRDGNTTIEILNIWRVLYRKVTTDLTITLSLTKMDADPCNGSGGIGGFVEQQSVVERKADNLWEKSTLSVSKGPWERGQYMIDSLYQYTKNTDS